MSYELDQIETGEPYYDHENDRVVVPRVQLASETVFDVPGDVDADGNPDQFTAPTDDVVDGDFEQIGTAKLRRVATTTELEYFVERDDFAIEDDVVETAEQREYDDLAKRLGDFHGVAADVETEKTFSPNLRVRVRKGGGQASDVHAILASKFDTPDDFLAVIPSQTQDGDPLVVFRVKRGGY